MGSTRRNRILLFVAALVVATLAVSYAGLDSSPPGSADRGPVESVEPAPGDLVPRQTVIEVDLETGYRAELWVLMNASARTWQRIPDSEMTFVDDKLNHLDDVAPLGIRCALAAWGFNGPREIEQARVVYPRERFELRDRGECPA